MKKSLLFLSFGALLALCGCGESASSSSLSAQESDVSSSVSISLPKVESLDDFRSLLDEAYKAELEGAIGGHAAYYQHGSLLETIDWDVYSDDKTQIKMQDSYGTITTLNYEEEGKFASLSVDLSDVLGNSASKEIEEVSEEQLQQRVGAYYFENEDGSAVYGLSGLTSYYLDDPDFLGGEYSGLTIDVSPISGGYAVSLQASLENGDLDMEASFLDGVGLARVSASLQGEAYDYRMEGSLDYGERVESADTLDPDDYELSSFSVDLSMVGEQGMMVGSSLYLNVIEESPELHLPVTYSISSIDGDAFASDGKMTIKAVKAGQAEVTVSSSNGVSYTFAISAYVPEVTDIFFDEDLPSTMQVGESITFFCNLYPAMSADTSYAVKLGEGEEGLAKLAKDGDSYTLEALQQGTVHVTAYSLVDESVSVTAEITILAGQSEEMELLKQTLTSAPYYQDFYADRSIPLVFNTDGTGEISFTNMFYELTTWEFNYEIDPDLKTIHFSNVRKTADPGSPYYEFQGADAEIRDSGAEIGIKCYSSDGYETKVIFGR